MRGTEPDDGGMRNEDGGEKATRASLLARVRDWGDDEGWREFHALYGPLIRNVARQSGLPESEADDVAQETLLAVAKKLPGFEYDPARGSFKAWLRLNVRSRIADHWRRVARREKGMEEAPRAVEPSSQTDFIERIPDPKAEEALGKAWEKEWETTLLRAAADRVRTRVAPKTFLLFDLLVLQGQSLRDVCRATGASAAEAYLAKHRVGKSLRREVEQVRAELGDD